MDDSVVEPETDESFEGSRLPLSQGVGVSFVSAHTWLCVIDLI